MGSSEEGEQCGVPRAPVNGTRRGQWLLWILDPEAVLAVLWGVYLVVPRWAVSDVFRDVIFVIVCLLAMSLRSIRQHLSDRLGLVPLPNTPARRAWKYSWRGMDILLAAWILWR